jgi:hypothetical protein
MVDPPPLTARLRFYATPDANSRSGRFRLLPDRSESGTFVVAIFCWRLASISFCGCRAERCHHAAAARRQRALSPIAGFLPRSGVAPSAALSSQTRRCGCSAAGTPGPRAGLGTIRPGAAPCAGIARVPPPTTTGWALQSGEAVVARYRANGRPPGQEIALLMALYPTQRSPPLSSATH